MHTGAMIVIEGPDYVGKTTLVQRIHKAMVQSEASNVVMVREPGGTIFAEKVRHALLHSEPPPVPNAEVLGFLAAKADVLAGVVYPALSYGQTVLCDRFTRSLIAYQGGLRGFDLDNLMRLLAHSGLLIMPHLEIILSATREVRDARHRARGSAVDNLEEAASRNRDALELGYQKAQEFLYAFRTIEIDTSELTEDEVFDKAWDEVQRYLKLHRITQPGFIPLTYDEWKERLMDRAALA